MLVRRFKLEEFFASCARSQAAIKVEEPTKKVIKTKKVKENGVEVDQQVTEFVENQSYNNPDYVIKRIFDYIEFQFNTIGEFDTTIMNTLLENIMVPNELVPFIIPRIIRLLVSNFWTKDLTVRSIRKDSDDYSTAEWNMLCHHFRRFFRKDAFSDMTPLSNIKKSVNLADVLSQICVNGKVAYDDKAFYPLEVPSKSVKPLFEDEYFNTDAKFVVKRYISEIKFR